MSNLQNTQTDLEIQTRKSNIKNSLILALERTGNELKPLDNMVEDIYNEFYFLKDEEIQKAIRNGSLGIYGKMYRFSTQEVCIWIREYKKSKQPNLGI